MSGNAGKDTAWEPCPPGELRRVVDQIKLRRRREAMKQIGASAAAVMAAGIGGYFAADWLWGTRQYNYGGIACSEVMPLLRKYHRKSLNQELTQKIAIHLKDCPNCRPAYRRIIEEFQSTAAGDQGSLPTGGLMA